MSEKQFILDKTTLKIIRAANDNFKKNGLKRTSLKDIALSANVVRKTLYNRFNDRFDLVEKLITVSYSSIVSLINFQSYNDFNELVDKLIIKIIELPIINLGKLRDEITNVYPTLKVNLQESETSIIKHLSEKIKNSSHLSYRLRAGINSELAAIIIWKILIEKCELLKNVLSSKQLNTDYVKEQIKDILFFGIFK